MSRPRAHPLTSGLVAATVLVCLMAGIVVTGIPGGPQIPVPWNSNKTLHVVLTNSNLLAPHASVDIAGIKVGEVQSVEASGHAAVADLQIQQRYFDIHQDATVYLRAHGLFGPKYISIVPGTSSSPLVPAGGTIGDDRTVQPVNLDAILHALQAPEQQDLRTTIVELGTAAAGRGDDFNHLLAAANSFTKVLDAPVKTVGGVSSQLSDMLVNNDAFNSYFAQAPLDQLVANSEVTFQAFAANAAQLQSLLTHADNTLTTLDASFNGQPGNLANTIQQLGKPGGVVDRLDNLTYVLSLFGANLTGKEASLGSDKASQNVVGGIVGAITSIASAFIYSDPCPTTPAPAGTNDNHCSVSPDGRMHYLDARLFNFPPGAHPINASSSIPNSPTGGMQFAGLGLSGFASMLGA